MSDNNNNNTSTGVVTLLSQYKTETELKAFASSQMKVITDLTKKIKKLEEENKHLQKLLKDNTPSLNTINSGALAPRLDISDEEQIAVMELRRLRDISLDRGLTLEETKRADMMQKMLASIRKEPQNIVIEAKKVSDDELIAALQSGKLQQSENE